jgi:hypothetical protein
MRFSALACVLMLAACGPTTTGNGGGGGGADAGNGGGSGSGSGSGSGNGSGDGSAPCNKMDILFVVDDSGSMSEEQDNLATNFPMFANAINAYMTSSGQALDYHLAVTTTGRDVSYTTVIAVPGFPPLSTPMNEMGDDGALKNNCSLARRWLERTDPNVATTLACRAKVGTSGPSMEMPMDASELALRDRIQDGTNAGFLRDDALLAIVMITDEDDCSRTDNNFTLQATEDACKGGATNISAAQYKDFLDGIKGPGRWAAAVIAGPSMCSSSFGSAVEATKLKEFIQLAGPNGVFGSICDGTLEPSLQRALQTFQAACESFPNPG